MRRLGLQQDVDLAQIELGFARHVGQVGVDLDGKSQRLADAPARRHVGKHVESDIGVGAEADAILALRMRRHQLGEHIGAHALQVRCHLRIVEAGVALLHPGVAGPCARLQEELGDLDVGRQALPAQRLDVVDIGVGAEHAIEQGLDETPLQAGAIGGAHQREPCEDAQAEAPVGLGQAIERVGELDGLADADRDGERKVASGAVDDRLGTADGVARTKCHGGVPGSHARHLA